MHGANEFESYEDFGAYHAATVAEEKTQQSFLGQIALAFVGTALISWAIIKTVGVLLG